MFELNSRTVCAGPAMPVGFIFSSALFVYGFMLPEFPSPHHSLSLGSSPHWEHFFFLILLFFFLFASGGVNKGLKNCSKNFYISVFMLRGKAKCTSPRGAGKQWRREGQTEMLFNRENIEGQMGKCEDILFSNWESVVIYFECSRAALFPL